jgi:hypothetical protein
MVVRRPLDLWVMAMEFQQLASSLTDLLYDQALSLEILAGTDRKDLRRLKIISFTTQSNLKGVLTWINQRIHLIQFGCL